MIDRRWGKCVSNRIVEQQGGCSTIILHLIVGQIARKVPAEASAVPDEAGTRVLLLEPRNVKSFEFILVPVFGPEGLEGALELFGHDEVVPGAHFDELRVFLAEIEP